MTEKNRAAELQRIVAKLEKAHGDSVRHLARFHRYTAGTATSNKAWGSYLDASERFDAALAALRAVLELPQ